jgi:hypothetical protein
MTLVVILMAPAAYHSQIPGVPEVHALTPAADVMHLKCPIPGLDVLAPMADKATLAQVNVFLDPANDTV